MNIENLEAFIYVIHLGSFNRAAEALFLSQPSVTARIQALERELDCRLFDRVGKQTVLSEEGKRFLPYAQQIIQTYQKGKQHVQQNRRLTGELRIGCTVSVANYIVPELLPQFKAKYPQLRFRFITGVTDELADKVLNREVDIGLVRNVAHPSLNSVKFFEDPIRLHVYAGHPFIGNKELSIEAIGDQPLVFFECGSLDWQRIHRIFESLRQPPNVEIQTDNSEMAKKLVMQRAGICFLPTVCVRREVAEGKLFAVDFPETADISMQTNIVTQQGEHEEIVQYLQQFGRELISPVFPAKIRREGRY